MEITGPTKKFTLGVLLLSVMMLLSFLVPGLSPEASAFSGSPCPSYSIQDVFDDPAGNWDGDQVNNSDELFNGLNPCTIDTTQFCANGGNPLCQYYTYVYVGYPTACQVSITTYPSADYDGDGIPNNDEVRNGADPCQHPCPHPTNADLALNPNGSWDADGISNVIEVWQGTNPCDGYTYNPCPYYSLAQVNGMPTLDWDRDGVGNADEVYRGTNPCQFNSLQRLPHVTAAPRTGYFAPTVPAPLCPHGYPHYHHGNGLCYANPVGRYYVY